MFLFLTIYPLKTPENLGLLHWQEINKQNAIAVDSSLALTTRTQISFSRLHKRHENKAMPVFIALKPTM